jgi:GABA permease
MSRAEKHRMPPAGRTTDARLWDMRKRVTVILAAIGAVVAAVAVALAVAVDLPALAWILFAMVSGVVLALSGLAPLAFERTRVSALPPAAAVDAEERLLVIADSHCRETAVCDEIMARLDEAVAVHLVVPIRVSHFHFLTDDEDDEQREAEEVMRITVGLLSQRGVAATGAVGDDKPLESMNDALAFFPATRVLLITPPAEDAYWLERDLLAKACQLTNVPVTQVVVPATSTIESNSKGSRV